MTLGESLMQMANQIAAAPKTALPGIPDSRICPCCEEKPREKRKGLESYYSYCTECLRKKRRDFIAKQKGRK